MRRNVTSESVLGTRSPRRMMGVAMRKVCDVIADSVIPRVNEASTPAVMGLTKMSAEDVAVLFGR